MKMNKRFLSLALAFVMVLGSLASLTPVLAAETAVELSDIDGHWAEAHIKKAVEEGLVKGYKDGTFKPGNSLARAEMATILARAFELETEADLKDFTDVKSTDWFFSAMGMAVEAGIFKGDGDKLMPRENIRRDHAFATLARALKLEKAEEFNKAFPDLDEMDQSVKGEVAALVNLGYVEGDKAGKLNPAGEITRAEMTKIVNLALGFKVDEPEEKELKVESVSAINAKGLKVTFNKAVEDTTKAVFAVKRDALKANVASFEWNEEKTEATLNLTTKILKGEYEVTVTGLTEEALVGSVKTENEKVDKIEILTKESAKSTAATNSEKIQVPYKVLNQYGEDLTKTTTLTPTAAGKDVDNSKTNVDQVKGLVTIATTNSKTFEKDAMVSLTLVHGTTGTTATQQITVLDFAKVDSVELGEVYNKDGKTLSEDTDTSKDKFYVPVTVKDQYGNTITKKADVDGNVIITNTNGAVLTVNSTELKTIKIDKEDVLAVEITGTGIKGTSDVLVIATATGKQDRTTVQVAEGIKLDQVAIGQPEELVTANKDAFFPLTVVNNKGEEVNKKKDVDGKLTVNGGTIEEVKGELFIKVVAGSVVENQAITVTVTSETNKVATQTVVPKAEAVATIITGIDTKKVDTATRPGDDITVTSANLVIEDQYGQEMKDTSGVDFIIVSEDTDVFTIDSSNKKSNVIKPVAGAEKTTAELTFYLWKSGAKVDASAFTKGFSIVKDSAFVSYEVADLKPIKVDGKTNGGITGDYQPTLKVTAKDVNGATVTLKEGTDYGIIGVTTGGSSKITNVGTIDFGEKDTLTKDIKVVINATGKEIPVTLTLKYAEAKAEKVVALDADDKVVESVDYTNADAKTKFNYAGLLTKLTKVKSTDQYGVEKELDAANKIDSLTFTKVSGNATFANNGKSSAEVTNADKDAVVDAKITVDGVSTTIRVTFKSEIDTVDPIALTATENADATEVTLTFSEALNKAAAETVANYTGTAAGATNPSSAVYDAEAKTVTLTYNSAVTSGQTIILNATNIKDVAGNTIAATTFTRSTGAAGAGTYAK